MNVIDNEKLSATIKTALVDAQARGVALEDHAAAAIHDILHKALSEASSDVAGVMEPVLVVMAGLQAVLEQAIAESGFWRAIVERLNFSPPKSSD